MRLPHQDSYLSQAQFFKPNRRVVNLWRVSLAWVDLDTYRTEWGHLHPEPMSLALRTECRDKGEQAGGPYRFRTQTLMEWLEITRRDGHQVRPRSAKPVSGSGRQAQGGNEGADRQTPSGPAGSVPAPRGRI